jgi:hypothetical protein
MFCVDMQLDCDALDELYEAAVPVCACWYRILMSSILSNVWMQRWKKSEWKWVNNSKLLTVKCPDTYLASYVTSATSKDARADCWKPACGSLRNSLHCVMRRRVVRVGQINFGCRCFNMRKERRGRSCWGVEKRIASDLDLLSETNV